MKALTIINESLSKLQFETIEGAMTPRDKTRRVTLDDVATRAKVSAVTASRVLRKPEMVSAGLRARVDGAVQDLGYIPNQLASALASSRTGRVGVVVPSLTNGVFGDYLRALHDVFIPAGIQVVVLNSHYLSGREEKAIATMLGQFPEAMILAGISQTLQARKSLKQSGIPVVQTMELTDSPIDINIGMSQREAGYAATRHLFELAMSTSGKYRHRTTHARSNALKATCRRWKNLGLFR